MTPRKFSINFDYRCPWARNVNEHVVAGLQAGADWDVQFIPFSLTQVHVEEGGLSAWEDPEKHADLIPLAAAIVVRDRYPELLDKGPHLSLYRVRHDDGNDLRDEQVIRAALERSGVDVPTLFKELDQGWPFEALQKEHEDSVRTHSAFGVPTFVQNDRAVFVRLMTRPGDDGELAKASIEKILDLMADSQEINEFKYTSIPR